MPRFATCSRCAAPPSEVFRAIVTLASWTSFTGYGPLPGIVEATLPPGEAMRLGARVRVRNTDGSVHHEVVTSWEPGARYGVRMELGPPASRLMSGIEEDIRLEPADGGTRMTRRFVTHARGWWTWPLVWLVTHLLLKRAVRRHDRVVAADLERQRLRQAGPARAVPATDPRARGGTPPRAAGPGVSPSP